MLHVPTIDQRLVIEDHIVVADDTSELFDGSIKGFFADIRRQRNIFSSGDTSRQGLLRRKSLPGIHRLLCQSVWHTAVEG